MPKKTRTTKPAKRKTPSDFQNGCLVLDRILGKQQDPDPDLDYEWKNLVNWQQLGSGSPEKDADIESKVIDWTEKMKTKAVDAIAEMVFESGLHEIPEFKSLCSHFLSYLQEKSRQDKDQNDQNDKKDQKDKKDDKDDKDDKDKSKKRKLNEIEIETPQQKLKIHRDKCFFAISSLLNLLLQQWKQLYVEICCETTRTEETI